MTMDSEVYLCTYITSERLSNSTKPCSKWPDLDLAESLCPIFKDVARVREFCPSRLIYPRHTSNKTGTNKPTLVQFSRRSLTRRTDRMSQGCVALEVTSDLVAHDTEEAVLARFKWWCGCSEAWRTRPERMSDRSP